MITFIITVLHGLSETQLALLILIHLTMVILSVFARPYLWRSLTVIKIITDFLLLLMFIILAVVHNFYSLNFSNSLISIEESTVDEFNNYGWTIIIIVFLFIGLYIIKFLINLY